MSRFRTLEALEFQVFRGDSDGRWWHRRRCLNAPPAMGATRRKRDEELMMAMADGLEGTLPGEATLDGLAVEVGTPTKAAMRFAFRGADEAWMLRAGQSVSSEVVLSAGTNFVASTRAVTGRMTPTQLGLVKGYNPVLLPVLVGELKALRTVSHRYDLLAQATNMSVGGRRQEARDAYTAGITARQSTYQTLRDLLGATHPTVVSLEGAMRAADTADILANGLDAVADAIHAMLHGTDDEKADRELVQDLDLAGLDDALVTSLRETATNVRDTATLAAARPQDLAAAQRTLDQQDGRVLHVVGLIVRAFRRARRTDARLLVPELGDLKRIFGGASSNAHDSSDGEGDDDGAPHDNNVPTNNTASGGQGATPRNG